MSTEPASTPPAAQADAGTTPSTAVVSTRQQSVVAYRDALRTEVIAQRDAVNQNRAAADERRTALLSRLSDVTLATAEVQLQIVVDRREIDRVASQIDDALSVAARVAGLRLFAAAAEAAVRDDTTEAQRAMEATKQRLQVECADRMATALASVRSHRSEVANMLALHAANDHLIKGNVGVLAPAEPDGWADWAFLSETETPHGDQLAPKGKAALAARVRNPVLDPAGLEAKQLVDVETQMAAMAGEEGRLRAMRASSITTLKQLETKQSTAEGQLRAHIQESTKNCHDALQRTLEFTQYNQATLIAYPLLKQIADDEPTAAASPDNRVAARQEGATA